MSELTNEQMARLLGWDFANPECNEDSAQCWSDDKGDVLRWTAATGNQYYDFKNDLNACALLDADAFERGWYLVCERTTGGNWCALYRKVNEIGDTIAETPEHFATTECEARCLAYIAAREAE